MAEIQISMAAARVNAELTQQNVADVMHIAKQTVINWEKGKNKISIANLHMLSELYGIPIENIRVP